MRHVMGVFSAGLALLTTALAAPPEPAVAAFAAFAQATGAPGVALTVVEDGEIVWDEAIGFADLEQQTPMTTRTPTRIGSISKTMTAVAATRLASRGLIDLDQPASAYLKDFAQPAGRASLRQLASHTGCVRTYREGEELGHTHYASVRDALEVFAGDPLECEPGSQFIYSSFGFSLLSAVMAEAAGAPFRDVMTETLWAPIDLENTDLDDVVRIIPHRARYYVADREGTLVNAPFADNSYKYAGAGMLSSTRDLARFGAALMGDGFLSDAERDALFAVQHLSSGAPTAYGLGLYVDFRKFIEDRRDRIPPPLFAGLLEEIEGRRIIWHSGTAEGAVAILMLEPEEGRALALALNKGDLEKESIVAALGLMTALRDAAR